MNKPFLLSVAILAALGYVLFLASSSDNKVESGSFIFRPFPPSSLKSSSSSLTGFKANENSVLPTVLVPGMGDSCFNPGFSQLVSVVAEQTHSKSFCIGPGFDPTSDALNSFTKTMLEQLELFRTKVRANPALSNGFNAMGLSQGNLVIRAYIMRYNDPPVVNFISIHGPMAGTSSIPRCDPNGSVLFRAACKLLDVLVGDVVYSKDVQTALAQSNYFRDPTKLEQYHAGCQFLPEFLDSPGEGARNRLLQLHRLVLIMAEQDTMIFPKESEYFGAFQAGSFNTVIPGNKQPWYTLLGLDTLEESGRLITRTTKGEHLRFHLSELREWIDLFFLQ